MTGPAARQSKRKSTSSRSLAKNPPERPASAARKKSLNGNATPAEPRGGLLRETVTACVRQYLDEIDGEPTTDFYQLVLSQIEPPLLREVMAYTHHNQTRAAELLGLNRGTLRKKLRQYDISSDSP